MPEETYLALQLVMMPKDANPLPSVGLPGGDPIAPFTTVFGGVLLSAIDQAGAIGARREVIRRGGPPPFLVTVAINRVEFHKPVLVGDVVRFLTTVLRIGRTSITVHVDVEVDRGTDVLKVTEAEVVYVGIDLSHSERRPTPLLPG